jgi:DNA-nicking Smr family endonuclease
MAVMSNSTRSARHHTRALTEDERTLWSNVTRSIARLGPPARAAAGLEQDAAAADEVASKGRAGSPSRLRPAKPALPALMPFDRRLKQRLARGQLPIDARIDLHGLTQSAAHDALVRFLRVSRAKGARMVLVITGKGSPPRALAGNGERGVLRRWVPTWLSSPQLRDVVAGFDAAHRDHGGEGALYVWIRRTRGR